MNHLILGGTTCHLPNSLEVNILHFTPYAVEIGVLV